MVSRAELFEEERQRFELSAATYLESEVSEIKALRFGPFYKGRVSVQLAWEFWQDATGIRPIRPKSIERTFRPKDVDGYYLLEESGPLS